MSSSLSVDKPTIADARFPRRRSTGSNPPEFTGRSVSFAPDLLPPSPRVRKSKRLFAQNSLSSGTIQLGSLFIRPPKEFEVNTDEIPETVCSPVNEADSKKLRPIQHYGMKESFNCHPYLVDHGSKQTGSGMKHASSMVSVTEIGMLSVASTGVPTISARAALVYKTRPVERGPRIKLSVSAPSLENLSTSQLNTQITSVASATMLTKDEDSTSRFAGTSPNDHFQQIVKAANLSCRTHPSLSLHDFFLEITPEHIEGYQTDLIAAIRNDDVDALRQLYESGRTLQACNKFGESVVHMACRRGSTEIVRFLLEVAGVCVRLRDDYGRTPLHDALWTQKPEFDCVEIILRACPDLLLVTDKRGFTPLSYVRRDHWVFWCEFLERNQDIVLPKELV